MAFQIGSLPVDLRDYLFDFLGPKEINRLKGTSKVMKRCVVAYENRASRGILELISGFNDVRECLNMATTPAVQITMRGGCRVDEARHIVGSPHRESISRVHIDQPKGVKSITSVSREALDEMATLPNLSMLSLEGIKFASTALPAFTRITHLRFSRCFHSDFEVGDDLCKAISKLANLRSLDSDIVLSQERVKLLSPLAQLETVRVGRIDCDRVLALTKTFPNLTHLTGAVEAHRVFFEWLDKHQATTPPELVKRLASLRFSDPDVRKPTKAFFSFFPYPGNQYEDYSLEKSWGERLSRRYKYHKSPVNDTRDRLLQTLKHGPFAKEDLEELLSRSYHGPDIEMLDSLIQAGADVNARYGSLLRHVVQNLRFSEVGDRILRTNRTPASLEYFSFLLKTDVDPSVVNQAEIPVLYEAIRCLRNDLVEELLKAKVPPNLKVAITRRPFLSMFPDLKFNNPGFIQTINPLQMAFASVMWGEDVIKEKYDCFEKVVALLRSKDVDINQRDFWQRTILHWVISFMPNRAPELVETAAKHGIDINARDKEGKTALDRLFEKYDKQREQQETFMLWLRTYDQLRLIKAESTTECKSL